MQAKLQGLHMLLVKLPVFRFWNSFLETKLCCIDIPSVNVRVNRFAAYI